MQEVKKIVVIGPESTGKSTLCKQLAAHYNTLWCREYAREYLIKNGTGYSYEDLLHIAKGQLALEDEFVEKVSGMKYEASVGREDRGITIVSGHETRNSKPSFSRLLPYPHCTTNTTSPGSGYCV